MTFTYSPATPDDTTRVRWHINDTVEDTPKLTDEEIGFAISETGDWKRAVIWCINRIIQQLADESGETLDWLKIDRGEAIKAYQQLKKDKQRELEVTGAASGRLSAGTVHSSRYDSPNGGN